MTNASFLCALTSRAYSRDPSVYADPEAFMPERFLKDGQLNPDVRDSASIAFGYGRRYVAYTIQCSWRPLTNDRHHSICPGRHFAEASLFMIVTTILHTLTISAPLGADGRPVRLEGKMTHGILS